MCLGWLPTDNYFRVKENRDGERGDASLGLWRERWVVGKGVAPMREACGKRRQNRAILSGGVWPCLWLRRVSLETLNLCLLGKRNVGGCGKGELQ